MNIWIYGNKISIDSKVFALGVLEWHHIIIDNLGDLYIDGKITM